MRESAMLYVPPWIATLRTPMSWRLCFNACSRILGRKQIFLNLLMLRINHLQRRFWDDRPKTIGGTRAPHACEHRGTCANHEHLRTLYSAPRSGQRFFRLLNLFDVQLRAPYSTGSDSKKALIFFRTRFTLFTFHPPPKDCPSYRTRPILSP